MVQLYAPFLEERLEMLFRMKVFLPLKNDFYSFSILRIDPMQKMNLWEGRGGVKRAQLQSSMNAVLHCSDVELDLRFDHLLSPFIIT